MCRSSSQSSSRLPAPPREVDLDGPSFLYLKLDLGLIRNLALISAWQRVQERSTWQRRQIVETAMFREVPCVPRDDDDDDEDDCDGMMMMDGRLGSRPRALRC